MSNKTSVKKKAIPGLSREDEEQQLVEILSVAKENLNRTRRFVSSLQEDLKDLQENYDYEDKETLVLWNTAEAQLRETKRELVRFERARKKPYFGRIDFKDSAVGQKESYYVGRVGIAKDTSEPLVIDWRAPIASVYYESTVGPCKYDVRNEGSYEIDLLRKRTYEIKDDKLVDFFDSDVVANDDLLTKYLAKSKKAVLGEIIATIQQEQNAIIRKSPKTNLIVQGVAGSGKTTVAMHRISYILYNYEEEFRPEDFYIVGSNRILLNYITSVLPDLDVYGVSQMTMEELFVRLLYEDWDKHTMSIRALAKTDQLSCVKGSYDWFHDLENYCKEYEKSYISQNDVYLEKTGALLMSRKQVEAYLENNPTMSMQEKVNMLNEFMLSALEIEMQGKNVSFNKTERTSLEKKYGEHYGKPVWKGSIFDLYEEFLTKQALAGKAVLIPNGEYDIYDLAALAYLYKRIKETDGIREASHVVIDEAQDFGMMAYGVLHYCLRGCTYTIMGDVSQNIHFGYGLNDWEELKKLILTGTFDSFELLRKSYRNTVEISDFATEILRHGEFSIYPVEPILRHGNEVEKVKTTVSEAAMTEELIKIIKTWQKQGQETIAVICRDEEEANMVRQNIGNRLELVDGNLETAEFSSGVMVLPVIYTKGLEFDAVVLYNPTKEHYPAEDGYVKLLYVAATRALHELVVLHTGDLSDLIAIPVSEEKRMASLNFDTGTRTKRYENKTPTIQEIQKADVIATDKERARRGYIGPKHVRVDDLQKKPVPKVKVEPKRVSESQLLNPSKHGFMELPNSNVLMPKGHSKQDNSIRWMNKTKERVELTSSHGVLRITPINDSCIRVQFRRGQIGDFVHNQFEHNPEKGFTFQAKDERTRLVISTNKVTVIVEKKIGAVQFYNSSGKLLLKEKDATPRQLENAPIFQTWTYFDFSKKEKIKAKGISEQDLKLVSGKAAYICFGGKKPRMPVLVSDAGYELAIAAESTTLFCNIPMYGNYVYTEDMEQTDYYFTLR